MTDENKPVTKAHHSAHDALARVKARRDAVQARTASWAPNAPQEPAGDPTDQSTEGDE